MFPFPSPLLMQGAAAAVTDPNFSSVVLLSGFEGANGSTTITDESAAPHTLTANGGAQISTAQSKFGGSSLALDGTGDFVSTPDSADWLFSTQFTVEGWFRFLVKQSSQALIGQWDNAGTVSNGSWYFFILSGNLLFRTASSSTLVNVQGAWVPTLGQWYHLAACRDAAHTLRVFVDGVMLASASNNTNFNNSTGSLSLGRIGDSGTSGGQAAFDFNGNMDEVRITKGVARYASDSGFTVPSAAFPRS